MDLQRTYCNDQLLEWEMLLSLLCLLEGFELRFCLKPYHL